MMSGTHFRRQVVKKTQKDNFVTLFFSKLGHFYLISAPELLKLCYVILSLLDFQGTCYQN